MRRFFVFLFVGTALTQVSTLCRNIFNLLFAVKELNLTEEQYGSIMGVSGLISVGIVLVTGYILDRVSPLLIFMSSGILVILLNFFGYFVVHDYRTFFDLVVSSGLFDGVGYYPDSQFVHVDVRDGGTNPNYYRW